MKILVIPDVHLKPQMFKQATALMHQGIADRAVCLMDIPDDWDICGIVWRAVIAPWLQ